jgi:hypothetical protein
VASYTLKAGEHLPAVAARFGFASTDPIWNHPANRALREKRKTPEILMEGDVLTIPDKTQKWVVVATGATHSFVLHRATVELRLRLRDLAGRPIKSASCQLRVDGDERTLTTDGDGIVKTTISPGAQRAVLVHGEQTFDIDIGRLDPVEEESGWHARLINLGYLAGPLREAGACDPAEVRAAVEEFQCDHQLPLSGEMDGATRKKLVEAFGC